MRYNPKIDMQHPSRKLHEEASWAPESRPFRWLVNIAIMLVGFLFALALVAIEPSHRCEDGPCAVAKP